MSIENAITDHAAALRELAAAIRATIGSGAITTLAACVEVTEKVTERKQGQLVPAAALVKADPELDAAVAKVEAEAKPTTAKAALAAALAAAEAAKAAKAEEAKPVEVAEELAAGPLSYEKDVHPLLVQVGKVRDNLVDLLREFGAKNGAGIKDSDYPAVAAKAKAIIAARG